MKKIVIFAALLLSCGANAESKATRCVNVSGFAYQVAVLRDSGVTSKQTGDRIKALYKSGNISEQDAEHMYLIAGFVYSSLADRTPNQVRNIFNSQCK